MLEVVFSDSAAGGLTVAQSFGRGPYPGGVTAVILSDSRESITSAQRRAAQRQAQEQARREWEEAVPLGGQREDIFGFSLGLSMGDVSGGAFGPRREQALQALFSFDPHLNAAEHLQRNLERWERLQARCAAGEPLRIWYSREPEELCGLCWLLSQLPAGAGPVYGVCLPQMEETGSVLVRHNGWGDIAPGQWSRYLSRQQRLSPAFVCACSTTWRQLQQENAPLRAMLNGQLVSMPETLYDSFLLRQLDAMPSVFPMAQLIGRVLGKCQLAISDSWLALRIDKLIASGVLEVIQHDPQGGYRRTLRKTESA